MDGRNVSDETARANVLGYASEQTVSEQQAALRERDTARWSRGGRGWRIRTVSDVYDCIIFLAAIITITAILCVMVLAFMG